jgi:hypothetical protein
MSFAKEISEWRNSWSHKIRASNRSQGRDGSPSRPKIQARMRRDWKKYTFSWSHKAHGGSEEKI